MKYLYLLSITAVMLAMLMAERHASAELTGPTTALTAAEQYIDPVTGPLPVPDDPVSTEEVLTELGKVMSDWKNLGCAAGLIALLNLLVLLLRFPPVDRALEDRGMKWIKPYVAMALGALISGYGTLHTGAGLWQGVVAGVMAALGSVGLHQAIDNLRARLSPGT